MELRDRVARLTDRQRECLWLVRGGFGIKEIADRLGLKPETVEYHLSKARLTLGANRSSTAARLLAEHESPPPGLSIVGPSIVAADPPPPPSPDAEGRPDQATVADAGIVDAASVSADWLRPPLPTADSPTNGLGWRGKLGWTVGIALGLALLLGAFKALLS